MSVVLVIIAIVVFIDQLSKFFISKLLSSAVSIPLIKNIFHLTLVRNTGAAFGLFKNQTYFFVCISIIAVSVMFFLLKQKRALSLKLAFSLIIGGAVGNLIDRITLGYVFDFLDFRIWPVFNIADSAITAGTILLTFKLFLNTKHF